MKCYVKDYPRPQFVRNNWENLNGFWDFAFDDENIGEVENWQEGFTAKHQIKVPFTYETKLSGIHDENRHDNIWYHKTIQVDGSRLEKENFVIHFEGSDFETILWVNGKKAGSHRGGYVRFSFDITKLVKDGNNEIVVKVEDSFDMQQPRGKQRWLKDNFGCWYVQTTGIWKTVWTEYVPKINLKYVKMTPNLEVGELELDVHVDVPENLRNGELMIEAEVYFDGHFINKIATAVISDHVRSKVDVKNKDLVYEWVVKTWSPQEPNLYDIEFRIVKNGEVMDRVGSYFAMREIRIEGQDILLNGDQLYQRLILDQGYWKDSGLTPPSEEALIEDIDKIHALGYNGLRKHQKVEDERFLYWCDVKGMLVWSEMAAAYDFSDYAVEEYTREWMEIVKQNYNHPCIITWTPFNESWGVREIRTNREQQHFTEMIYNYTKSFDSMRPVVTNDGWQTTITDILTIHDYEESGEVLKKRYTDYKDAVLNAEFYPGSYRPLFANGYKYQGQPVIVTEFGGIAFDKDSGWGYGNKVTSEEAFLERFENITMAIKELPYVCGYCYTQVSDVQQEVNGLMDMERNFKIAPEKIRKINERVADCWKKE